MPILKQVCVISRDKYPKREVCGVPIGLERSAAQLYIGPPRHPSCVKEEDYIHTTRPMLLGNLNYWIDRLGKSCNQAYFAHTRHEFSLAEKEVKKFNTASRVLGVEVSR